MEALIETGLDRFIRDYVADGRPLLGICLGMQMLAELSTEFGETAGLCLLPCRITKLTSPGGEPPVRLPNVGWLPVMLMAVNDADLVKRLFSGVDPTARFYFIHSFAAAADSPVSAAVSEYEGIRFASVIARKNIVGTQFHPEKSGPCGLKILSNFIS
jgi:glutamine amidotransferase